MSLLIFVHGLCTLQLGGSLEEELESVVSGFHHVAHENKYLLQGIGPAKFSEQSQVQCGIFLTSAIEDTGIIALGIIDGADHFELILGDEVCSCVSFPGNGTGADSRSERGKPWGGELD